MASNATMGEAVRRRPPARSWLAGLRPKGKNEPVGYLFILPYLLCFIAFMVLPTIGGFYVSLTNWGGLSAGRYIGLNNYAEALQSDVFWQTSQNTVTFAAMLVPAITILGLLIAVFVNQKFLGFAFARVCFYSPYVMAVTVTGLIWMWMLEKNAGIVNYYLGQLVPYLYSNQIPWLTSREWAMPSIVITTVWWLVGFQMVILLAGLQDIPVEMYEAAKIDGANGWQTLTRITLPLLRPSLTFVVIVNVINALRVFGQMFLMTSGGPAGATTTVVYLIYMSGFQSFRFGYSAAISFLLFLAILILTIIQLRVTRAGSASYY